MKRVLSKKYIPKGLDPKSPKTRALCGTISGVTGIVLNVLLTLSKLFAGISSGSVAVIADAVNNLTDAGSSLVTLVGFRLAARRADRRHPYGHGRMEYLCGMAVSVLILFMGLHLMAQSLERIWNPQKTNFTALSCVILVTSLLVKVFLVCLNTYLADFLGSSALSSVALDARNDCIATLSVLISLLIEHFLGLYVDGLCGIVVSGIILVSGCKSLSESVNPLLGERPDPELKAKIEDYVRSTPGVLGIHELIIHDYGPGRGMLTLHVEMDAGDTLPQAHELADQLENELTQRFGLQTLIHMDPVDPKNASSKTL